MPKISVIVPVYKVEAYLDRCVESILAQTFSDFELILVDDGSPDNCPVLCDQWAQKDDRITVIHQENRGLSAARNAGIDWAFANSDSQWLSFVDSDDWIHPQFLEILDQAVEQTNTLIAVCSFQQTEKETVSHASVQPDRFSVEDAMDFYLREPVVGVVAWNKLYNKRLFSTIRYPVGHIHEDEFVTYRLLYLAKSAAICDTRLYYYFYNPEGITKCGFSEKRYDGWIAMSEACDFFKEKGLSKNYVAQARAMVALIRHQYYDAQQMGRVDCCQYLKKELRKALKKHHKACRFTFEEDYYSLDVAYPKLVWTHDRFKSFWEKTFTRNRCKK